MLVVVLGAAKIYVYVDNFASSSYIAPKAEDMFFTKCVKIYTKLNKIVDIVNKNIYNGIER